MRDMVDTGCGSLPSISQDGGVEAANPQPTARDTSPDTGGAAETDATVAAETGAPATVGSESGAVEAGAAAGAQPGRGGERSPRDMALSLVVLLVPIALLLIFYRFVLSGDAPASIDPGPTIQEAQAANVFPIAVPRLGDDWHVATATWRRETGGATLRLGYVDPDEDPVQLVESNVAAQTLIPQELTGSAKITGRVAAGTRTWQRYDARPGEEALVLYEKARTIIIVGNTDTKNLETLAASLR
jgi:hypothetical protein